MRECCRQVEAVVVSNSRNKIHRTWGPPYTGVLYMTDESEGKQLTRIVFLFQTSGAVSTSGLALHDHMRAHFKKLTNGEEVKKSNKRKRKKGLTTYLTCPALITESGRHKGQSTCDVGSYGFLPPFCLMLVRLREHRFLLISCPFSPMATM